MTSSQCISCKWFSLLDAACKAYPKGIPTKIITGQHDHRKPYKGDNGIRWEPLPEEKIIPTDR